MSAPAGWFPDPGIGPGAVRYWNGDAWTEQIQFAPPPPGPPVANRPPLADYGSRLGGYLIDWLIVSVVSLPLLLIFHAFEHTTTTFSGNGSYEYTTGFNIGFEGIFIHAAIVLLYGTLFCGSARGQTIGMRVTGNKAVDISTGQSIGYLRALGRAALEYVFASCSSFRGSSTCSRRCGVRTTKPGTTALLERSW